VEAEERMNIASVQIEESPEKHAREPLTMFYSEE
jgi:hypothetical protein